MDGSTGNGVAAPESRESLYELLVPSRALSVLFAMLKMLLLPLKRRRAEKAVFMVPIEDSVAAVDIGRLPLDRYVLAFLEPILSHEELLVRAALRRSITSAQLLVATGPRAFCRAM
jgi:hypothetical protein